MKKNTLTTLKFWVVLVALAASCIVTNNADALWRFDWGNSSQEFYRFVDPTTGEWQFVDSPVSTAWTGGFYLPDSAVSFDWDETLGFADLSKAFDFKLSGKIWDGTYMVASDFRGGSLGVVGFRDPATGVIDFLSSSCGGDAANFVMEDPLGVRPSIHFVGDEQVGPNEYPDQMFLPGTSTLVDIYVHHGGAFGGYLTEVPPVPEPSTIVLLVAGLASLGLVRRLARK